MIKDLDVIIDALTMTEDEYKSFQKADNEDYEWNDMLDLLDPDFDSNAEIRLVRRKIKSDER